MKEAHVTWLRWALNIVIVALIGYLVFWPTTHREAAKANVTLEDTEFRVSGPYAHENLAVYLIHADPSTHDPKRYITLEEGLRNKWVEVKEKKTASVNELVLENKSDAYLFLQEGDLLKGGQQDRTIYASHVVPPRSGEQPVNAFCVEPTRWTAGVNGRQFDNPTNVALAPKEVRAAAKFQNDQQAVWNEVANQRQLAASNSLVTGEFRSSSFNEAWESDQVKQQVNRVADILIDQLRWELRQRTDVRGMAIAINGRIEEVNIYPNRQLLEKQYERLLKSYAVQAIMQKGGQGSPAVSAREVAQFMCMDEQAKKQAAQEEQYARRNPSSNQRRTNPDANQAAPQIANDFMYDNTRVGQLTNNLNPGRAVQGQELVNRNGQALRMVNSANHYERKVNDKNRFEVQETTGKWACAAKFEGKSVHYQFMSRTQPQAQAQPSNVLQLRQQQSGQVGQQQLRQQSEAQQPVPRQGRAVQTEGRATDNNTNPSNVQPAPVPQPAPGEALPTPREEEALPTPRAAPRN